MDAIPGMIGSIVGQHDLRARPDVSLPSRNIASVHSDAGHRISGPVAAARTGMDFNTIAVVYMRQDSDGKTTNVTFATYERMQ